MKRQIVFLSIGLLAIVLGIAALYGWLLWPSDTEISGHSAGDSRTARGGQDRASHQAGRVSEGRPGEGGLAMGMA